MSELRLPAGNGHASVEALPEVTIEALQSLLTFSPDALVVIDQAGILTSANEQVCKLFGYTPEELVGHALEMLLPSRFHTQHPAHRERYVATPHPRPMGEKLDLYGRRKDGSEFPVDVSLRPLLIDKQLHVIAAVRDVTSQRIAERERLLQTERLRVLTDFLNQARDAMIIRDPINRITAWNHGAEQLYGWTAQEALGRVTHTLLKTRYPISHLATEARLNSEGQWSGELVHTRRNGRTVRVESHQTLLRDEQGETIAILEMNHPVSEQKQPRATGQLTSIPPADRLTFFQQIVDALPSSLYIVRGPDARLVLANREVENIWGAHWSPGQPMQEFLAEQGITLFDVQGHILPPERWATRRAVECQEAVHYHQEVIRRATGAPLPVLVHAVPLQVQMSWLQGDQPSEETQESEKLALVIHQDITPLKEAEYLKDEFIGVAAHELRAPLAVLKSAASMLRVQTARGRGPELADWQREALLEIEQATDRLAILTDELLDITRLQEGRLQLHLQPTNLVTLVQRVITFLQAATTRHHIVLHTSQPMLIAFIDAGRIEQVLTNIIGNAIKYSPQGGEVIITVQEKPATEEIEVSVQDEGMGIPSYQHAQIFGRFMRADNARAAGISGTGLGLYLCREFVERHGGRLWFHSQEGAGSTFFLTLPTPSDS